MPHFKCVACKTRLHVPAGPSSQVDDPCPGCGVPLEPVGELTEIVGFQAIEPPAGDTPDTQRRMADRIGELIARRRQMDEADLDAKRWLDDGGSFSTEAVAQALPLPAGESTP